MVPSRITVVTLGARDLAGLRDFYAGLGWECFIALDDFAAFRTSGTVFTLYDLGKLATDAGTPVPRPDPAIRANLALNVDAPEQVDETIEAVRAAGARIAREPTQMEWGGRSAYFADPEDNYWEVAWVPADSEMAGAIRAAAARAG